jgi:hypothetical protein
MDRHGRVSFCQHLVLECLTPQFKRRYFCEIQNLTMVRTLLKVTRRRMDVAATRTHEPTRGLISSHFSASLPQLDRVCFSRGINGYNTVPVLAPFSYKNSLGISISYNFMTMIDIENLYDNTQVHHYYYILILPIFSIFFGGEVISD